MIRILLLIRLVIGLKLLTTEIGGKDNVNLVAMNVTNGIGLHGGLMVLLASHQLCLELTRHIILIQVILLRGMPLIKSM